MGRALKSVEMNGNRVLSICMETDETIRAAMFVDTTYEGDLLPRYEDPGGHGRGVKALHLRGGCLILDSTGSRKPRE